MGHRLVSLVILPFTGSPLSTHQHNSFGRRITREIWSISKVKAGPLALATIPTSFAVLLVAGLGYLCALSLFLQPKHQAFNIRSKTLFYKSRLCRYQLNLVLHLFCSWSGCLVATGPSLPFGWDGKWQDPIWQEIVLHGELFIGQ